MRSAKDRIAKEEKELDEKVKWVKAELAKEYSTTLHDTEWDTRRVDEWSANAWRCLIEAENVIVEGVNTYSEKHSLSFEDARDRWPHKFVLSLSEKMRPFVRQGDEHKHSASAYRWRECQGLACDAVRDYKMAIIVASTIKWVMKEVEEGK